MQSISINQPVINRQKVHASFSAGKVPNIPWDIQLARNPQLNRLFIDAFGSVPWQLLIVRNEFERLEHILSLANFIAIGTIAPILLGKLANNLLTPKLQKQYKLSHKGSPLSLPFEWLEPQMRRKRLVTSATKAELEKYGLKSIRQLTPKLANHIAKIKIGIILLDLLLVCTKGQTYNWLKNWMTEKLSGRSGFSGIFNEANAAYVKQKSERYNKDKKKRFIASLAIGYGSALALPLALMAIYRSPRKLGQGLMGKAKQFLPWFNYTNVVYMSKFILFWEVLSSYNFPALISARDSNEFREKLTKGLVFDFFYFVGDDLLSGKFAQTMQRQYKKQLGAIQLFETRKITRNFSIPKAKSYLSIFERVAGNKNHIAFKLAKKTFWAGMVGTTLALGILTPLLNIYYTRAKVRRETASGNF